MTTADEVAELGRRARTAAIGLAPLPRARKDAALLAMADALVAATDRVLAANATDLSRGRDNGMAEAMLDRLALNADRVAGPARSRHGATLSPVRAAIAAARRSA